MSVDLILDWRVFRTMKKLGLRPEGITVPQRNRILALTNWDFSASGRQSHDQTLLFRKI
jgi:hypothetical protein